MGMLSMSNWRYWFMVGQVGGKRYILGGVVVVLVGKEESKYWEGRVFFGGVCEGGFIEALWESVYCSLRWFPDFTVAYIWNCSSVFSFLLFR